MKTQKRVKDARPVTLMNPLNSELWICDDYNNTKEIDGVSYISVYKPESSQRTFFMRKDALRRMK